MIAYVTANRDYACHVLSGVEGVRCTRPESSYLLWVDATDALPAGTNAAALLLESGVGVNDGASFGWDGRCFRLNYACQRKTLQRGLERIVAALATRGGA